MKAKVLDCIYAAVDEVNEDREDLPPLTKEPGTPIHGAESGLDSLGLINFVVALEEELENRFGMTIVLSDDQALLAEPSPFRTIGSLSEYIELRIEKSG